MILHILADYILPKDNFVISVDEKRPFSTLMGLIITRLEMPSMAGHALYICKGKPPRPTIPLLPADLKKSPKKLGMKQGDFLMIKKEAGGIKERKEAIKKHQKDVQLQEEDPETFKRLERERSRIQRRENFFAEKIRDADSDDELPKEVILGIMGPVFAAAAIAVIAVEIGSWLEPRQLSKLLVTLAAAVASAVPTYFGDREYTRRAALLKAPPAQQARRASPRAALLADPGIVFTTAAAAKAAEGHFDAFFARLAGLYRAKPGDVVDEILASFAVAADLTDPLFAVASAAFALRERFFPKDQPPWFKANTGDGGGEEAGPPPAPRSRTEVDALVLSTLGVDAAEVDRALLCGMPADNTRLDLTTRGKYVPCNQNHTAYVSRALHVASQLPLPPAPEPLGDDAPLDATVNVKDRERVITQHAAAVKERAEAWKVVEANVKWIFHAASLASDSAGATYYKACTHIAAPVVDNLSAYERGSPFHWPAFCQVSTDLRTAEKVCKTGYELAAAKPETPSPKPSPRAKKGAKPGGKKAVEEDNKAVLFFKSTKVPTAISLAGTTPYAPEPHPVLLSPFNVFQVVSTRQSTLVCENGLDVDLKWVKTWEDPGILQDVRKEAETASLRLWQKLVEAEVLASVVTSAVAGLLCIPDFWAEDAERTKQRLLDMCCSSSVVLGAAAAAIIAEEHKLEEDAKKVPPPPSPPAVVEPEPEPEPEPVPVVEPEPEPVKEEPPPPPPPPPPEPVVVAPPPVVVCRHPVARQRPRRRKMEPADWAAEDLEASKKFEERMSERRVTLDNYEERRKLQTEKWEKDRMDEIDRVAKARQELLDKAIREQEDRSRMLALKNEEAEQRMTATLREVERRQERLMQDAKELEDRKVRLDDEQDFAATQLSKIQEQQQKALQEIARENEELRRRLMQQTDEILNLKTDSHQSPALEKVMRQASKVGDDLDRLHSNVAFQSTPQFAPVLAWLVGIGMGRYSNVFAENEFDLHAVAALSEADLDSMGITALGPRRRILAEARALADKLQTSGIKLSTESEAACVVPSVTSNALLPESGIGSYTLQQILTDFYTKYDQAKAPQVTGIFHQFHGQYDALFATIASIYPLYFPSPYRERTVSILQKTCPALLPAVDVLLDLHQGREIEFLGDLLRLGDGIPSSLTPGVGSMPSIIPTSMSVADQAASASSIQRMATAYDPLPVSSLASGGGAPSVAGLPAPPPYQASPSPQRSVSFQSSSLPPRAAASPAGSRPLSAVLGKLLSQQGTPHPERVAEILSANFVGYEPQVLKAFEEVSMGKRPGL